MKVRLYSEFSIICLMVSAAFRLVDGSRPNNGRVEVFFNGMWGTICDDSFDQYAATVACKYFGFR